MSESTPQGEKRVPSIHEPADPAAPDPTGAPVSVPIGPALRTAVELGLTVVGGGVALLFANAMVTPCVGATRSTRLSQAQRRQEIVEVIHKMDAQVQPQPETSLELPPDADADASR